MYHFFVEPEAIGEEEIRITGTDVNHIRNVLRMKPGEQILVSNGRDRDYLCELSELTAEEVTARILSENEKQTELPARIYLYQGLPKSDKLELIIQKCVELGVYRVIPVVTKRTIVKLDPKKEESRLKRWQAIAESAAKQSGRMIIPEVAPCMNWKQALDSVKDFDLKLIPFEHEEGMAGTRKALAALKPGMDVAIFIGPEGGFEDKEIEQAQAEGIEPVSLGNRILRTETAGLMILSVIGYLLESEGR